LLVTIGNLTVGRALLDLGAGINLIPLSMFKKIEDVEVRPKLMNLQLADRSVKHPYGIVENLIVKVDKFIKHPYGIVEDLIVKVDKFLFPIDFMVMDMEEDASNSCRKEDGLMKC